MSTDASDSETDKRSYTGPNNDELRSIARTMTRVSVQSENGEVVNPFTSDDPHLDPENKEFNVAKWSNVMIRNFHDDPDRYPRAPLGVSFKNLGAHGVAQDVNYQLTVGNLLWAVGERGLSWFKEKTSSHDSASRVDILKPMDGLVRAGELLMVLGRPGAGCSTFLRTMASQTFGFKVDKESVINYQGLTPHDIANNYRGDVTFCAETELHFPKLTVGQTLTFAARLKTPRNRIAGVSRKEYAEYMRNVVMATYGLLHTVNTKVGSDLIRGVSGGERKRVSIAELTLAGSHIQCWDNSTRGLDSATANEFIKTLRTSADTFDTTPLVAVYQASEEMYELFDKVILLYDGYEIFFGPIDQARQYFVDMGWAPKPRQSTPDFLTSLSQPSERVAAKGREREVPQTAIEFYHRWMESDIHKNLLQEIDDFNEKNPIGGQSSETYRNAYRARQDKKLPKDSAFTVGWVEQTRALCVRGFDRLKGDPEMALTNVLGNSAMAFIISSMFYNMKTTTDSFYHRTALIFFALLFNAFSAMLEIFSLFDARLIVQKHNQYAFYHPAIDAFASILTEMPVKIANGIFFNVILYFLANLRREPGNFFFFLLMNFTATLMMSHFFRTIGAVTNTISEAMIPANMILMAMVLFTGFIIPTHILKHEWTAGGPYIDPLAYAFEGLITNEFHNEWYECSAYTPYPPEQAVDDNFICSVAGAVQGSTRVLGDNYIKKQFDYQFNHQWRNWGILVGFVFFFLFTYMMMVYLNPGERTKGEVLVFPRKIVKKLVKQRKKEDAETGHIEDSSKHDLMSIVNERSAEDPENKPKDASALIEASDEIFYWRDVCYDVKIKKETRRLLNFVDGWVKPGTLTALMGSSGAGKTTLLDTLASRVTMGVVTGQMFVNGTPRDSSFQRTTGYAMQQDLHLDTSTVREALTFSALLRQPNHIPRAERIAYVDNVLEILEMTPYADAVVGVPGKGLNVEQRKRLTIGVELAARPKLLLFLDEPTSGLDSQTAWSICQLLKKLSDAGQAVLCTIHQPSAILLEQFDRLLFLTRGGRTVYFGETGPSCHTLISYFEKYGADPCPPDANPAEWMLSVVGAAPGSTSNYDFAEVWLHSQERQDVRNEISELMKQFNASDANVGEGGEDTGEFAAPLWEQYIVATKRNFQMLWRDPLYIWSKVGLNVFSALFNGFVFFKADTTLQGMQDLMFSVFMFTVCLNPMMNGFVSVFAVQRDLFEARERPSKIYSWKIFLLASLTAEIPWQLLTAVVSFVSWYYPAGLYSNARLTHQMTERGGMTLFYVIQFFLWAITLGYLLGAPIADPRTAANVSVLLFTLSLMFAGVLVTRKLMPGFWQFMYRVSPMNYWILGMLMLAIANTPVDCASNEWINVTPPDGMSCSAYFNNLFTDYPESTGYLRDPSSTSICEYCTLKSTNQYLASIEAPFHLRWRNFGIFWAYIAFNVFAALFLYWLARVPKSKSMVKKVDYNGRDVALEENTYDKSQLPPNMFGDGSNEKPVGNVNEKSSLDPPSDSSDTPSGPISGPPSDQHTTQA